MAYQILRVEMKRFKKEKQRKINATDKLDYLVQLLNEDDLRDVVKPIIGMSIVLFHVLMKNLPLRLHCVIEAIMSSYDYRDIDRLIVDPLIKGLMEYRRTGDKGDIFMPALIELETQLVPKELEKN
jgi:hypothetical protein